MRADTDLTKWNSEREAGRERERVRNGDVSAAAKKMKCLDTI